MGLPRLQGFRGDPALHAHLPHRRHLGAHPQSFVPKREDAQRPPRLQHLRECRTDADGAAPPAFCCTLKASPAFQGLDDEKQERGRLLGAYTYDQDGDAVQTFVVSVSGSIP